MPEMKCPSCDCGFVEEMNSEGFEPATDPRSDRSLSLLAPLLLGMLGGSSRRSRLRRQAMEGIDDDEADDEDDSDRELEVPSRRQRRRGSSALASLLQTIRDDIRGLDDTDSDTERDMERERRERERHRQRLERRSERQRDRLASLVQLLFVKTKAAMTCCLDSELSSPPDSGTTGASVNAERVRAYTGLPPYRGL
nr:unnamed protein product [Digitaria exilis]